jgi:hypothetical protein
MLAPSWSLIAHIGPNECLDQTNPRPWEEIQPVKPQCPVFYSIVRSLRCTLNQRFAAADQCARPIAHTLSLLAGLFEVDFS